MAPVRIRRTYDGRWCVTLHGLPPGRFFDSWAAAFAYVATLMPARPHGRRRDVYADEYAHFRACGLDHHEATVRLGRVYRVTPDAIDAAITAARPRGEEAAA